MFFANLLDELDTLRTISAICLDTNGQKISVKLLYFSTFLSSLPAAAEPTSVEAFLTYNLHKVSSQVKSKIYAFSVFPGSIG